MKAKITDVKQQEEIIKVYVEVLSDEGEVIGSKVIDVSDLETTKQMETKIKEELSEIKAKTVVTKELQKYIGQEIIL